MSAEKAKLFVQIPKWMLDFMEDVQQMRHEQNIYFQGDHSKTQLRICKAKESKVDQMISKAENAGYLPKIKKQEVKQPTFFNQ